MINGGTRTESFLCTDEISLTSFEGQVYREDRRDRYSTNEEMWLQLNEERETEGDCSTSQSSTDLLEHQKQSFDVPILLKELD